MYKNHLKSLQPGSRPTPPGIPNPTCPILLDARRMLDKAQDLHRALRSLRRSSQRCFTCPEKADCSTLRHYAHAVNAAIRDIQREWGLDQE